MENQEAYNAYKTLKNCLNKLSIDDSIYIIYNYHLYISNFKEVRFKCWWKLFNDI